MANRKGKGGSSDRFPLLRLQNHCGWWLQSWNQKMIASWQESDDKSRKFVGKQRPYSSGYGLPSGHIWLCELDCKEDWAQNWCLLTVVLEKTPESPLGSKEIKPVNLKGDQPWIFTERTDAEVEAPVLWSSDANRGLIEIVPHAGKDWGQKKRVPEVEMTVWPHQCNDQELGQTSGHGEGQGGLACCCSWGCKESYTTG